MLSEAEYILEHAVDLCAGAFVYGCDDALRVEGRERHVDAVECAVDASLEAGGRLVGDVVDGAEDVAFSSLYVAFSPRGAGLGGIAVVGAVDVYSADYEQEQQWPSPPFYLVWGIGVEGFLCVLSVGGCGVGFVHVLWVYVDVLMSVVWVYVDLLMSVVWWMRYVVTFLTFLSFLLLSLRLPLSRSSQSLPLLALHHPGW